MQVYETFTQEEQWKEYLQKLLRSNKQALLKAILVVYDNQTQEEKNSYCALSENRIGFNKVDAKFLTSVAKKIKSRKDLTYDEYYKARNKMLKYWKQLMFASKRKLSVNKAKKQNALYCWDWDGQLMFVL